MQVGMDMHMRMPWRALVRSLRPRGAAMHLPTGGAIPKSSTRTLRRVARARRRWRSVLVLPETRPSPSGTHLGTCVCVHMHTHRHTTKM